MEACRHCGSKLGTDAKWCGRCHEPVADPDALRDALYGVEEAKVYARSSGWRPDEHFVSPLPPLPRSRVRGGNLTFGFSGRLVITLLAVVPTLWAYRDLAATRDSKAAALYFFVAGMWTVYAILLLRHVWRAERVPHR